MQDCSYMLCILYYKLFYPFKVDCVIRNNNPLSTLVRNTETQNLQDKLCQNVTMSTLLL